MMAVVSFLVLVGSIITISILMIYMFKPVTGVTRDERIPSKTVMGNFTTWVSVIGCKECEHVPRYTTSCEWCIRERKRELQNYLNSSKPCFADLSARHRRMFDLNGTVGDAAVATILCICVVMPHRCGLGGGFMATYYNR